MDVVSRTIISAGMDASGVKSGMDTVTSEAAKMAASVSQSVSQMSRSLLDSGRGFDALARRFADGYKSAMEFATGIQTAYRAVGPGQDKLGLLPQILDGINAKYGVAGTAARNFALALIDTSKSAEERLRAMASLIDAMSGKMAAVSQGAFANIGATQPGLQASLLQQRLGADPIEQRVAAQRMAEVQSAVNRFAGVTSGGDTAARAADIEAYGKALDDLKAQYVPMFAAQQQYEKQIAGVSMALKAGAISEEEAAAANKGYAASLATTQAGIAAHGRNLDGLTGTTWSQQFAMRQLGVQSIQTFSGIATGQPILMTLIQQGHQVADIMFSAGIGFKALAEGVWNFTKALLSNPITLFIIGVTALTAALVGLVVHSQNAAERIGTLRNQMLAARDDAGAMANQVEQAARHLATTTTLGFTEASKAGAELQKNPAFQGTQQQLEALVVQAHRLSLVLGTDLPTANKILVQGLDNAAGAAQKLLDEHHFGAAQGVTQAWVDSLKQMTNAQAFQALSDKIAEVTARSRDNFTNLGAAWQRFLQLISTGEGGPGFWTRLGGYISDGLAAGLRAINFLIDAVERLHGALGKLLPWSQNGGSLLGNLIGSPSGIDTAMTGNKERDLAIIAQRESGNQNITQRGGGPASGYWQMEDRTRPIPGASATWETSAAWAGLTPRPGGGFGRAMDYSREDQYAAASALYDRRGAQPWAASAPRGTGVVDTQQQISTRAQAASQNALSAQLAENEKKQRDAEAGLRQAQEQAGQSVVGTGTNDAAVTNAIRYTQAITDLKKAHYDLIDPQQKIARSMEEANRPLQAQEGMTRRLAEAEQQLRDEARGTGVDQDALSRVRTAVTERGTKEIRDQIVALDLQTNSQRAQIPLLEEGGQAAENAAAFERAVIEARKSAVPGTLQYKQAVIDLTDAFRREIQVKHDAQAATDLAAMTREMELLEAQARLIGVSTMEREKELAVIRERHSLGIASGQAASDEQQRAIDQSEIVAGTKVQNDELATNYAELANATSQSFNTIGDAIANAFVSGEGAAVSFQNVLKAVIAQVIQEMIKLSIINPILKALFPGSTSGLATAGGVLDAIGTGGGGGFLDMTSAFAKGGVFSGSPSLSAFSNSIIATPTLFNTGLSGFHSYAQGGTGVFGESGPEAILPLLRSADGSLGVRSSGGGGGGVSVQVNTPITINGGGGGQSGKPMDPAALKALQQQIDITVRHAVRGVIVDERRPGGDLYR